MIFGAHTIIFSPAADETRKLLARVLKSRTVDAGGGWPIMALPPAEVAVHPTDGKIFHELYLMCDDLETTTAELRNAGIEVSPTIHEERWGRMTTIILPGSGTLGLYQPLHPVAIEKTKGRAVSSKKKVARSKRSAIRKSKTARRRGRR